MTEFKLHDMAGSVTGCVFHQLMLEAIWLEHAREEQRRSMLLFSCKFSYNGTTLMTDKNRKVMLWWLLQKCVLTISAG